MRRLNCSPSVLEYTHFSAWGDGQTAMSSRAGCTSLPPSTLIPRASASLPRQSPPEASLFTQGRIAAQIACEEVCGTAPGMLVTQKWVTHSSTKVGSFQLVGREVSKQP